MYTVYINVVILFLIAYLRGSSEILSRLNFVIIREIQNSDFSLSIEVEVKYIRSVPFV